MSAPSFWCRLAHLKAAGHPATWPSTVSWPHVSTICLQPAGGVKRVGSEERSILARRLSLLPCELKSWNSLSGFHIHRWEQGRLNVSLLLPTHCSQNFFSSLQPLTPSPFPVLSPRISVFLAANSSETTLPYFTCGRTESGLRGLRLSDFGAEEVTTIVLILDVPLCNQGDSSSRWKVKLYRKRRKGCSWWSDPFVATNYHVSP